jgi:hypothetical protein
MNFSSANDDDNDDDDDDVFMCVYTVALAVSSIDISPYGECIYLQHMWSN